MVSESNPDNYNYKLALDLGENIWEKIFFVKNERTPVFQFATGRERLFSVLNIMRVCVKPQMGRLREAFTARP